MKILFNNLNRKLIFAIVIWLICALFFVGLTLNISWRLEDRSMAINQVDSLRKQTYYIISSLQSNQTINLESELSFFEKKLNSLKKLEKDMLFSERNDQFFTILNEINQNFFLFKKNVYAAQQHPELRLELLNRSYLFSDKINELAKNIELENTFNIYIMRIAQVILMLMVLLSAILSLLLLNKFVIQPLSLINTGLKKITEANLTIRSDAQNNDDFYEASQSLNQMASRLEDVYQNLDELVKQKTIDLEKNNQELSKLYEVTSFLHNEKFNNVTITEFLRKILQLTEADGASIRLLNQHSQQMDIVANINLPEELLKNKQCLDVDSCFCGQTTYRSDLVFFPINTTSTDLLCNKYSINNLVIYKIQLREQTLGLLTLYFKDESKKNTEFRLVHLLTTQLAIALKNNKLILKDKQYAVLEERNIMAQGLHDSIAQSLSFLNLQLQMLDQALIKNNKVKIDQHMIFLKQGVQQCYDDVRELLNNFRLKLNLESFHNILQAVIERFKTQTDIPVNLNYISTGNDLDPQQQLQLTFIIQEALSNVRKHAHASLVNINFENTQNISLSIQDNGIGFNPEQANEINGHHIGLSIMRERISQVNGVFSITSSLNQGTTILVTIRQQQR